MDKTYRNTYALIMAGGVGSRFWPSSREEHPKQFIDVTGKGKSLLRETYERFVSHLPADHIFVITNKRYSQMVLDELPELSADRVIGEPMRKNTAPASLLGSLRIYKENPEARIVMAPADHLIPESEAFFQTVDKGLAFLDKTDGLITMGILPTFPHTGYGYIHYEAAQQPPYKVAKFTEKPDRKTAEQFLAAGRYLWNAGIFMWRASGILKAFEECAPRMTEIFTPLMENDLSEWSDELLHDIFSSCEGISIDYQIMEKAGNVYTIPADFRWSDVGSWSALYDLNTTDEAGNVILSPKVINSGSTGMLVKTSPGRLVVIHHLHDLMIIEEGDVMVILPRSEDQAIKELRDKAGEKYGDKLI